jgi:hypothetical protein
MEPPENWTSEAAAEFNSVAPADPSILYGELVFDSYLDDTEAVRSRRVETRRLLYDFPTFEIDLALSYSGPRLDMLMGHILPKSSDSSFTAGRVGLELKIENHLYSAQPNKLGEFIFKVEHRTTGAPLELRCLSEEEPWAIVLIPC